MGPSKRCALDRDNAADALLDTAEQIKAGVRAKVEHPFCVLKRQFGFVKVRNSILKKNAAQRVTLLVLSNLKMVRSKLTGAGVGVRPKTETAPCQGKSAQVDSKNNQMAGGVPRNPTI